MSRARAHLAAAAALLGASLLGACQGPPVHHATPSEATVPAVALGESLGPLEAAFDARLEMPRVVAFLPVRCAECATGLDAVRRSILRAYPEDELHVFVVLPSGEACDGCGADDVGALVDPRVTYFRDREGRAARAFARGLLPIAEATELYLFYPRGTPWHGSEGAARASLATESAQVTPKADEWWHCLGRIAPSRHCANEELGQALGGTMARLLADAAAQRASGVEVARR